MGYFYTVVHFEETFFLVEEFTTVPEVVDLQILECLVIFATHPYTPELSNAHLAVKMYTSLSQYTIYFKRRSISGCIPSLCKALIGV